MPGIYVHVPFCAHRCPYCDFNVVAGADGEVMGRFVRALRAEIVREAAVRDSWPTFDSVYVGGGTPTLLPAGDLADVLRLLREVFPLADDAEVSVEANPETVTVDGLAVLVAAGLTRLSVGAQSFATRVLATLGRRHDAERPLRAVEQARHAGVRDVNLDLIYGTPGEHAEDWEHALATAIAAGTDHVSAYALTVEAGTEFAARVRAGVLSEPDEDVQAERMRAADDRLAAAGLRRYEVSNWARPGRQSRHNLLYWRGGDWLGIGPGAHGHWSGRRWWSLRSTQRWTQRALAGESTLGGQEVLDARTREVERLMMGLRLVEGVPRAAVGAVELAAAEVLVARGLLADDPDRWRLTAAGFPLAGAVTLDLVGRQPAPASSAAVVVPDD